MTDTQRLEEGHQASILLILTVLFGLIYVPLTWNGARTIQTPDTMSNWCGKNRLLSSFDPATYQFTEAYDKGLAPASDIIPNNSISMKVYRAWYNVEENHPWIFPIVIPAWFIAWFLIRRKRRRLANYVLLASWSAYVILSLMMESLELNANVIFASGSYRSGDEWAHTVHAGKYLMLFMMAFFAWWPIVCHVKKWAFWKHASVAVVLYVILIKINLILVFSGIY
jgi:hypothetical protein